MIKKGTVVKSIITGLLLVVLTGAALFADIPAEERAALIAFYNATNGDNWNNNYGWKTPPLHTDGFAMPGTERNWHGISISGNHVSRISFMYSRLEGSIPPEIGDLTSLTRLDLKNNRLSGTIPPEIGNLVNLEYLELNDNQLTGAIPPEFSNLTGLRYCRLEYNQLTGSIPFELGNMTRLHTLYLNNNKLTGTIPPQLGNMTWLYTLYLNDNQLTGSIPGELFDLNAYLRLEGNMLTGELPSNLVNFDHYGLNIKYNGLYTNNPDIRIFLNEKNKGWEETQTITPANVSALTLSTSSIKISWYPILYREDTGGYEIYYSTTPGGPWTMAAVTSDKSSSDYIVSGLNPGTRYYFRVRTITDVHEKNANNVGSEYSPEVSAVTDSTALSCVLTVRSLPAQGVPIAVTPADNNGQSNGTSRFTRTYDKGTTVTLTAPEIYNGEYFLKWIIGDVDITDGILDTTMYSYSEVTAVYGQSNNVEVTVTTTHDNVPGSLREAITNANTNNKDTTIILPAGAYCLYGNSKEDGNQSGDLDIDTNHTIAIIGEGAEDTIIDGGKLDRVLDIIKGSLSITGVTIRNGETPQGADTCDGGDGGGIRNNGSLTMIKCAVKNNKTGMGGYGVSFLIGGTPEDASGNGGNGGGIYSTGSLTLEECTIENNTAGCGGDACYGFDGDGGNGGGIYNEGTQVLTDCIIRFNSAGCGGSSGCDSNNGGSGGDGGGIFNSGRQTIKKCRIINNNAGDGSYTEDGKSIRGGHGGGIFNSGEKSSVSNCIIKNNCSGAIGWSGDSSGGGGAIYNDGNMTLDNSTVNYNTTGQGETGGDGGGIYNKNEITITRSSICFNSTGSTDYYGNGGSGGGIYNSQSLTVKSCNIGNNITGNGGAGGWWVSNNGGNGGGICNGDNGSVILENCTVSSNKTGKGGDASWSETCGDGGDGGGIYNTKTIEIINCTIAKNETGEGGHGEYGAEDGEPGHGGGIYNSDDNAVIKIKNTIVADNKTADGGEGPDCRGTLNSKGYNLIEKTGDCTINGTLTGNITGIDPMLGPLSHNGGPTRTHALLPDSPAIDAGDSTGISIDQRGKPRPVDIAGITNVSDGSDIGAYEYNSQNIEYYTISGTITANGIPFAGVTLTFSNNGGSTITDENGHYSQQVPSGWSGIVTPSKGGYVFTPSSREYTAAAFNHTGQDYVAVTTVPSDIYLSRTQLNFSADLSGNHTGTQTVLISSGTGVLNWTISHNVQWLSCSPTAGTGNGVVSVSVAAAGLSEGTYTAVISVSDPNASNSPQAIDVTLNVYSTTEPPFGSFDTPLEGSTVSGGIPVTGWVLDDIEVKSVKIYKGNADSLVYIGDAVRVEGARPDIEEAYPEYPDNFKAGWGYMLLTNALPDEGNGIFTLHATAEDVEGHSVTLGTKTITCDNADSVNPFGTIDTPRQGGTASGGNFINWGWVLTPQPNTIPTDGSTINVWVDGINLGHPVYNIYREDIAALFPGYNNSDGAVGKFHLDTTQYSDGVHIIYWTAADDAGNSDGIGSRYFNIQNSQSVPGGAPIRRIAHSNESQSSLGKNDLADIPVDCLSPVRIKRGYNPHAKPVEFFPDENGHITIEITELERIEVRLFPEGTVGLAPLHSGPLPIGSTFDAERGVFYWQPGPGFIGRYEFLFVHSNGNGDPVKRHIFIEIIPRRSR